ncbi:hypothetical protein Tco_0414773 [Tanacetum coccineum]
MEAGLKSTMKKVLLSMVDKRVNEIANKTMSLYVAEGLLLDRKKTQTDMENMIVEALQKERESLQAELSMQINNVMKDDEQVRNADLSIWWSMKIKFKKPATPCQIVAVCTRDHDDHHDDDAHPEGKSSAKRQKTSQHGTYLIGESSSEQAMNDEPNPLGSDDDEVPTKEKRRRFTKTYKEANSSLSQLSKRSKGSTNDLAESRLILSKACFEHWKNLWARQHHIRRQEKQRDKPEEAYSESKIVEVVRILYELGHEHKYITKIMKVNLTASTIIFPGIERKKLLTITSKPVFGLIYENSKKEKRVMILKEIPKFCDLTLKRVLKMGKKFNKDVKYGYVDPSTSDAYAEYLEFYEEYIE